jgi:membrane associated rhomboid family serine protease
MGYGQSSSPLDSIRSFIKRGGMPVTYWLIGISVVTFLLEWFWPAIPGTQTRTSPVEYLLYLSPLVTIRPWTLLTYPLDGYDSRPFWALINVVALWFVAGSMERSWGSAKFTLVFCGLALVSALSMQLGSVLTHEPALLYGSSYPISGLIVVFCLLNSEVNVRPYGLFTIRAKYLAMLVPVVMYFTAGYDPIMNLFALGGCIGAYLYYRFGRSYSYLDYGYRGKPDAGPDLRIFNTNGKRTRRSGEYMDGSSKPPSIFNVSARIKSWQERRRLEEFFRKSGLDDTDTKFRDSDSDNKR